jgi:hypothetical protein
MYRLRQKFGREIPVKASTKRSRFGYGDSEANAVRDQGTKHASEEDRLYGAKDLEEFTRLLHRPFFLGSESGGTINGPLDRKGFCLQVLPLLARSTAT